MNQNIKKVVAVALTISAFSAIEPTANINFMTTKAYASSDDAEELDELTLQTSSGKDIQLYKSSSYSSKIDSDEVESGKTYYAKTSSSKVVIDIDGADEDYVRIFKGSSDTPYEAGDSISVSSGTTLKVRLFENDFEDYYDDDDEEYDFSSSDYNEYKIVIKDSSIDSDEEDDDENDDIYLSNIYLSEGDIDFDEDKTSYDLNVDSDITSTTITAEPEDDDYTVKINGTTVDDEDDYEKKVYLSQGSNTVKIKITDDDNTRTYTLNITRGSSSTLTTSKNESNIVTTTSNKWINDNGKWKYYDALGIPLTNTWFYDKNYEKTYYLQTDGTMATGWIYNGGHWYYLDSSGAKQFGWKSIDGSWYYLDGAGIMKTGWFKDSDGTWYYLQESGAMAINTTIDGYDLGTNGAWIK